MVEAKEEEQVNITASEQVVDHEWYLAVDGEPDGPYSIRDLDVKYRT